MDFSSSFCSLEVLLTKNSFFPVFPFLGYFFFHSTNFPDNLIYSHDFNYNQFVPPMPPWTIGTPNLAKPLILLLGLASLTLFSSKKGALVFPSSPNCKWGYHISPSLHCACPRYDYSMRPPYFTSFLEVYPSYFIQTITALSEVIFPESMPELQKFLLTIPSDLSSMLLEVI